MITSANITIYRSTHILTWEKDAKWRFVTADKSTEKKTTNEVFDSEEEAIAAAKALLDCYDARCQLEEILADLLDANRLTLQEYQSCSALVDTIASINSRSR